MKFIVTGGAGLIGSELTAKLLKLGHDVLVLDSFQFSYEPKLPTMYNSVLSYRFDHLLSGARIERCNLTEKSLVNRLVEDFGPAVIIHLASMPLVSIATKHIEEARCSLSEGLLNLLEVTRNSSCVTRFVYVSSSMVYGDFSSDPMPEDGPQSPCNIYGGLKLAGEILLQSYLCQTETEWTIIRPSAVFGSTEVHQRVVQKFCTNALSNLPLTVFDSKDNLYDFTYVEDIANGLVLAATHRAAANQTFNITFGKARTLHELVEIIRSHVPDLTVTVQKSNDKDRSRRGSLCIQKAEDLLGYQPKWSLENAIPVYLNYLSQYLNFHAEMA